MDTMDNSKKETCPLCKESAHITESYTNSQGEVFFGYSCFGCRVFFWTPFKNPGAEWYEKDERYAGRNQEPLLEPNWNHKKIISFLSPKKGKVLDIGCGTGNFLAHAEKKGWDTYGIDFDRDAILVSKNVFKLKNTEVNDLMGFKKSHPGFSCDLVTFFDVFEHIDNHNEFISNVKELLNQGGFIALSMPYRKGARWLQPHDLPPRHLTRWGRTSLRMYLERQGFSVKYITRRSEGLSFLILKLRFRYGKYTSWNIVSKLRNYFTKKGAVVLPGSSASKALSKVSTLAKIKDVMIFGIPALIIYVIMFFTPKRFITLYAIAQKK